MASPRTPFVCARCTQALRVRSPQVTSRSLTTAPQRKRRPPPTQPLQDSSERLPRWKETSQAMKMPIRLRPRPKQPVWKVNTEDEPLNAMYDRFIGNVGNAARGQDESMTGKELLPEEVKWLAVTHKSFDHARRGSNDRLAFLGKRIVDVQTSMALLNAPSTPGLQPPSRDVYQHSALEGLENITTFSRNAALERTRLAKLASSYGIDKVMRWKPKKSDNLQGSGIDTVLAHTMYSIIGALALQRGGEVASKTVRERILKPLGLR